ncbi:MAG: amino acid adenylation domain-containing protein [Crocinitomix sp.]|jgi:amino acid adenylation domain-containing protein
MENVKIFLTEILKKEINFLLNEDESKIKVSGAVKSLTEEDKENIVRFKGDIIKILKLEKSRRAGEFAQINKLASQENYLISDSQRRLWALSQFEHGSQAYNMPLHIVLNGTYDIDSFKKAIRAAIDRHEILRTVFKEDATGELKQWIIDSEEFNFEIGFLDYRNVENQGEAVETFIAGDAYKTFDLENGPLIRATLLQVEDDVFVFYYNMHHIVSDGWSGDVLAKDVFQYYEAFSNQKAPELQPLRIQYKDYSAWQLEQLNSESVKAHSSYWVNQMSGELPLLTLPTTKQRPKLKTNNGRAAGTNLSKEATTKFKAYLEQHGGTLFMGVLATWNAIFYRYTNQTDIIIGTPIAGRNHADLKDQIGYYANTLALRNEIDPSGSFNDLFGMVKQNTLNAYAHQIYPFDRLVEELDLQRDTSRSAVFDVILNVHNNAAEEANGPAEMGEESVVQSEAIEDLGKKTTKFDLLITVEERNGQFSLFVEYNTDVYEKEMIAQFLSHYKRLTENLLSSPDEPLNTVSYLSDAERAHLLIDLNDTSVTYSDKTIIELFEIQAVKTPNNLALEFGEQQISYKELNEKCNRLANYLSNNISNINNEMNIGVMLERSIESVVAMIAIMKTGACYLPVDHEYPTDRVNYIAEDSHLTHIISRAELTQKHGLDEAVLFDIGTIDLEASNTENPTNKNVLADASFIIYTSGSTGKPKGVIQTHRMMSNLIQWGINDSGIGLGLKHLQYSSFSFDASLHDIYFTLSSGGSCYIVEKAFRLDYQALKAAIIAKKIEVLSLPTSALTAFALEVGFNTLEEHNIKHIITTGEQLYVSNSLKEFLENNPSIDLYNQYGPTEVHVVTNHIMNAKLGNIESPAPVGHPISNTSTYILDQNKKLVPKGVAGEIYFGGISLAKGYMNLKETTDEKFIVDPFNPDQMMYTTGDVGKWRPDGVIEFIGRIDDQVKIRGFRVELGEIEQALSKYKALESIAVIAKLNENNENELVAYLTSNELQNSSDLREFLKKVLPDYMLPGHFVQLDQMPLTSNGKVDKKALPSPAGLGVSSGTEFVAPTTETEKMMVQIWEDVLQRQNIGIKDDFFVLGGHSLNAIKTISKMNKEFETGLKITNIFTTPTIEELAANIDFALNQKNIKQKSKNLKEIEL